MLAFLTYDDEHHRFAFINLDVIQLGRHSAWTSFSLRGGVIYVNPGSAEPRRFSLPISAGEVTIDGDAVSARTVVLV